MAWATRRSAAAVSTAVVSAVPRSHGQRPVAAVVVRLLASSQAVQMGMQRAGRALLV